MTKRDYIYWGATGLLALAQLVSGTLYLLVEDMAEAFRHLGFPDYFRVQLGLAKIVGSIALLAPLPRFLKEWTYFGFITSFVSAFIAHTAVGDPIGDILPPVIVLGVLAVSYVTYQQRQAEPANDQ